MPARPGAHRLRRCPGGLGRDIGHADDLDPWISAKGLQVAAPHRARAEQANLYAHGSITTFIESGAIDCATAASTSSSLQRCETNSRTG